ncbi:MAG: mechanosensitive ion channel [Caldilineaceae bacterium]|nr:mechanosensitive ion channel [Caldilineaceae bacterium]
MSCNLRILLSMPFLTTLPSLLWQEDAVEESTNETQRIIRDLQEVEWVRILTILAIAWLAIFISRWLVRWLANRLPARFRLYLLPVAPILRLVFITAAFFRIFPLVINITSSNIITILGALGLAIGFAFKDYVSSILAGVVAIYERPYRTGDWVKIDNYYGEVTSVGVRALRLVTPDDTTVTIPHSKLWDNNIANANDGLREHQCIAHFYLHPSHDAHLVRQKLWDVGMTSPYTQLDRAVTVIVQEQPWGTHYQLKAYPIDGRDEFQYISDLTVRGKAVLSALGIQPALVPIGVHAQELG